MKKVVADTTKCLGNGLCVMTAPRVFTQNEDDGLVQVIRPVPEAGDWEAVERAVNACPSGTLRIVETDP